MISTVTNTDIQRIFDSQKANMQAVSMTDVSVRKNKLRRLLQSVMDHRQALRDAMFQDFRKHPIEVDLTEIYPIKGAVNHTIRHLGSWMKNRRVSTPLAFIGSRAYYRHEPKGVVLIISPWNFPVNLTFGPLVSAIAAGNCVVLKPSEMTPHTAAVMGKIIRETFDENEIALVEGDASVSQSLLELPFNHIFFTGSPSIGKIVMEAASKNLSSITLELGGKSPAIIDDSANLDTAASRIALGKLINNGQICLSPDYVLISESRKDAFLKRLTEKIDAIYSGDAHATPDYCRIVNQKHCRRIKSYLDDAVLKGAKVVKGGRIVESESFIEPTVVCDVSESSLLMTEEIFGPVLPVITYKNIEEAIRFVQKRDTPLALYIFSTQRKNIQHILQNTRAGGSCINHCALHFYNPDLPFGGHNHSGIGKAHGRFGFELFSNARSIYDQVTPFSGIELMSPPYNSFKQKLVDLTLKWL